MTYLRLSSKTTSCGPIKEHPWPTYGSYLSHQSKASRTSWRSSKEYYPKSMFLITPPSKPWPTLSGYSKFRDSPPADDSDRSNTTRIRPPTRISLSLGVGFSQSEPHHLPPRPQWKTRRTTYDNRSTKNQKEQTYRSKAEPDPIVPYQRKPQDLRTRLDSLRAEQTAQLGKVHQEQPQRLIVIMGGFPPCNDPVRSVKEFSRKASCNHS